MYSNQFPLLRNTEIFIPPINSDNPQSTKNSFQIILESLQTPYTEILTLGLNTEGVQSKFRDLLNKIELQRKNKNYDPTEKNILTELATKCNFCLAQHAYISQDRFQLKDSNIFLYFLSEADKLAQACNNKIIKFEIDVLRIHYYIKINSYEEAGLNVIPLFKEKNLLLRNIFEEAFTKTSRLSKHRLLSRLEDLLLTCIHRDNFELSAELFELYSKCCSNVFMTTTHAPFYLLKGYAQYRMGLTLNNEMSQKDIFVESYKNFEIAFNNYGKQLIFKMIAVQFLKQLSTRLNRYAQCNAWENIFQTIVTPVMNDINLIEKYNAQIRTYSFG